MPLIHKTWNIVVSNCRELGFWIFLHTIYFNN